MNKYVSIPIPNMYIICDQVSTFLCSLNMHEMTLFLYQLRAIGRFGNLRGWVGGWVGGS